MLTFDQFELDDRTCELRGSGERVAVEPKALNLLAYLVRHRDRVVPKADLLEALWPNVEVGETALTQAIKGVRKALGDDGAHQRYVATVRGRGYRFIARVEERVDAQTAVDASPLEPMGRALVARARRVFIGREDALRLLLARLDEAVEGAGRVVVVLGEPGIGKSRLVEELGRSTYGRGPRVLLGRCPAGNGVPGYWPWVQIVRAYFAEVGKAAALDALGPYVQDVAELIPDVADLAKLTPRSPALIDADGRFRSFDGFVQFLARASAHQPLLLVLEDLHWADQDSLALLRFVARELSAARVLLIVTCRDTALLRGASAATAAVGELLREDPERRLTLDGLGALNIAAFVEAIAGQPPSDALVAMLARKTAGNPLYLGQLLRGGDVEARLTALEADGAPAALSDGLRDCVERHLATLSPDCRRALTMAAVLGAEPRLSTLSTALGASQSELLDLVDEAIGAHVLERAASWKLRFAHEVLRDALVHGLRSAERARLHAAAAEALAVEYAARPEPYLDELAYHYRLAAPVLGHARAIDALERAARQALASAAVGRAVKSFELALETLAAASPNDAMRLELLLGLGDALCKTEDLERALRVFREAAELARALGDGERLARAALGYAFAPESGDVDEARVALLESALAFRPACQPSRRARLLARLGEALYFAEAPERRARSEALAHEAVTIARELGDPDALLLALRSLQYVRRGTVARHERLRLSAEMLRIAEGTGDPERVVLALLPRMGDVLDLGDLRAFDEGLARIARASEELRLPLYRFYATMYRTTRWMLAGQLEAAERSFVEALAFERPEPLLQNYLGVQMVTLRREQGRLAELEPSVRALAERFPEVAPWRCGLGLIACDGGRLDEARAVLEHFVGREVRSMRDDLNRPVCLAVLATICAAIGDPARAGVLYEALAPLDGVAVTVGHGVAYWSPVSQSLGVLAASRGELDRAVAHLEEAVATTVAMEAKALTVWAQMELGRALARRGRGGDGAMAECLLAEARQTAEALGMRLR